MMPPAFQEAWRRRREGSLGISRPETSAVGAKQGMPSIPSPPMATTRPPVIVASPLSIRATTGSGGYEKRPRPSDPAGQLQGDGPQGTLTSQPFTLSSQVISFLIGGGCDINTVRVELLVDGQVVQRATGKCTETLERVRWNVSQFMGRTRPGPPGGCLRRRMGTY